MSAPKHRTAPGCSYFVTTKCWQGRTVFQVPELAQILIKTMLDYREQGAYLLHEFVIMPDLLTPSLVTSLEKAVQVIKGGSSHRIHLHRGHKMEIWQKGFHDWTIRDLDDWRAKVEYIRMNPVRARLVEGQGNWPYSSAAGSFEMDPIPTRYLQLSSGAKAQVSGPLTLGLKPRPPKESPNVPLREETSTEPNTATPRARSATL